MLLLAAGKFVSKNPFPSVHWARSDVRVVVVCASTSSNCRRIDLRLDINLLHVELRSVIAEVNDVCL